MNKKRILFLSKLILILILTGGIIIGQDGTGAKSGGCGGSKSKTTTNVSKTNVNDLDSRRWNLIELNGVKTESSMAFIEFVSAEKRFAGNAGCNRMFGKFETNDSEIKFSGIGTTKIACSQEGVMKLESDFIKALENTTRFEQTGEMLDLYAGNNLILKFSAADKDTSDNDNSGKVDLEDKQAVLQNVVTFNSLCKVKVGMTVAQASKTLGVSLKESEKQGDCYYVSPRNDFNEIGFMVNNGSIARFDVSESGYATDKGAKVGDTEAAIKRLYEGMYKVSPHKYVDGHYITIEMKGGKIRHYF